MLMSNKSGFNWSVLLGAAFLMATSSIGPGFLTQTTVFTQTLLASFGFVILISIILDIGAQLNVWRVIGISGKRGQDVANMVMPGLGYLVALLIVMGGLGFNIGNIAGAGMGFNVIFGIDTVTGAVISAVTAVSIFLFKEAGKLMDKFTQIAGFVKLALSLHELLARALGDDDDGVMAAFQTVVQDREEGVWLPFQREFDLRHQTVVDVRIGQRRVGCDESAVAPHHVNEADAVRRALRLVVRHGDHWIRRVDGGLETEGLVDVADVVVDRLRNADNADVETAFQRGSREIVRGAERAVPPDAEEHVDVHADETENLGGIA